jgi:hypothetical protein
MCLDFKRRETTCERRECDHHRAAISLLEDPAKRLIRARGFSVKTFFGAQDVAPNADGMRVICRRCVAAARKPILENRRREARTLQQ